MKSETFCILPWVHAAAQTDGSVQLCCVARGGSGINLNEQTLSDYWNFDYVKDARRRMLAGQQVKACERCYLEETHGYKSLRLVEMEARQGRCGKDAIQQFISETRLTELSTPLYSMLIYASAIRVTCNSSCAVRKNQAAGYRPRMRIAEISHQNEPGTNWHLSSLLALGLHLISALS